MKKLENLNSYFGYFYTVKNKILETNSKFQKVEILNTEEFGKVLLLDGITQVSEKNEFQYHELMAHIPLLTQPDPKNILVIGGGDGGVDREVLKHPSVQKIDHVDLDGEVIEICKKHLPTVSGGAFQNTKLHLFIQDGRKFVEDSSDHYDAVIMDMTDPFGPSARLYTYEYFLAIKKRLRSEKSSFVMHIESPISRPEFFNRIYKTLKAVFKQVNVFYNYIQMYGTMWAVAMCSENDHLLAMSANNIDAELEKRNLNSGLSLISGETFIAMQATYPYIKAILAKDANLITDHNNDF